ncbi:MAG: hypothetical protein MZW92_15160 [Comamonadaceae bacterium]|nr:hypothetical protein [Comamonadaceae bacterium]
MVSAGVLVAYSLCLVAPRPGAPARRPRTRSTPCPSCSTACSGTCSCCTARRRRRSGAGTDRRPPPAGRGAAGSRHNALAAARRTAIICHHHPEVTARSHARSFSAPDPSRRRAPSSSSASPASSTASGCSRISSTRRCGAWPLRMPCYRGAAGHGADRAKATHGDFALLDVERPGARVIKRDARRRRAQAHRRRGGPATPWARCR